MKIPNKRELQLIALNHSPDIDFKDVTKVYKKCAAEPYSFLVNNTTFPSNNPLKFQKKSFKNKYSQTCIRRPLLGPLKSSRLGQVVIL